MDGSRRRADGAGIQGISGGESTGHGSAANPRRIHAAAHLG